MARGRGLWEQAGAVHQIPHGVGRSWGQGTEPPEITLFGWDPADDLSALWHHTQLPSRAGKRVLAGDRHTPVHLSL